MNITNRPFPPARIMSELQQQLVMTLDSLDLNDCYEFDSNVASKVRQASQYIRRRDNSAQFAIRKISDNCHGCWRLVTRPERPIE